MTLENYLTTTEAAGLLGVTEGRVYQFVRDGRLTPAKLGKTLLFPSQDVIEFSRQERPRGRPKNSENSCD
jgi:excisionase family DNA binding protein